MVEIYVDPARMRLPETGIYVRACARDGDIISYGSFDIAHLDLASLRAWLREKSQHENVYMENIIALLLGHRIEDDAKSP